MLYSFLGSHPALSIAELTALTHGAQIQNITDSICTVAVDTLDIERLGGSQKLAMHIKTYPTVNPQQLLKLLQDDIYGLASELVSTDGKVKLGVSWYGFSTGVQTINAGSLSLKKILKKHGLSVRIIPNKTTALNTASVRSNKLHQPKNGGLELLLINAGTQTHLAYTISEQDIDGYAARDHGRPKRDAYVGMLPPKLAQIMINLVQPEPAGLVADIFCGTGVVLQEALLLGNDVFGSDLDERMVSYSKENLDWLQENTNLQTKIYDIIHSDATEVALPNDTTAVVSEMYLGKPLNHAPTKEDLHSFLQENESLLLKTLTNLSSQLQSGAKICFALPAWKSENGRHYVDLPLETLRKLGYNPLDITSVSADDLIYARSDQVVGQKLLLLQKGN